MEAGEVRCASCSSNSETMKLMATPQSQGLGWQLGGVGERHGARDVSKPTLHCQRWGVANKNHPVQELAAAWVHGHAEVEKIPDAHPDALALHASIDLRAKLAEIANVPASLNILPIHRKAVVAESLRRPGGMKMQCLRTRTVA